MSSILHRNNGFTPIGGVLCTRKANKNDAFTLSSIMNTRHTYISASRSLELHRSAYSRMHILMYRRNKFTNISQSCNLLRGQISKCQKLVSSYRSCD